MHFTQSSHQTNSTSDYLCPMLTSMKQDRSVQFSFDGNSHTTFCHKCYSSYKKQFRDKHKEVATNSTTPTKNPTGKIKEMQPKESEKE